VSNGPVEPSADMRQLARACRDMYDALLLEGFDERQALTMLGYVIGANRGQS